MIHLSMVDCFLYSSQALGMALKSCTGAANNSGPLYTGIFPLPLAHHGIHAIQAALSCFPFPVFPCYGLWFLLYEFMLKPDGHLDHLVTEYVTIGICNLLDFSSYHATYTIALKHGETYVFLAGRVMPVVRIGASCNG